MSTGYYLLDNRQVRAQYGIPRRGGTRPSGVIVVHTAENRPDLDGPDSGAESVAAWLLTRTDPGSYHSLVDSDSIVRLAPTHAETWHETSTNRHAVGVSAAVRAHEWHLVPEGRRRAIVRNLAAAAAEHARVLADTYGITVPARRITRAEALARVPGFIGHGEIDTARRTDPGPGFDWAGFLAEYAAAMAPPPAPQPEPAQPAPIPEEERMDRIIAAWYRKYLGRTPTEANVDHWLAIHSERGFDPAKTFAVFCNEPEFKTKNPGKVASTTKDGAQ